MAPSGTGLDFATLISTSIECILYGISLVMFGGTVWALTHGRPKDEINWSMALVALILTVLSTIHLTVDIQRLIDGFITEADIFPGGPAGFFADVTQRTFIIKNTVYVIQTLLGDAVLIYRCYVVWQRLRVIILPLVLWCSAFASSIGFLYHVLHETDTTDDFLLNIGQWVISFYVLTLITNVISSALLAYRIWAMNQNVLGVVRVLSRSGIDAGLVLRILVDAAILYTLTLFSLLMCYIFKNISQFIVLDMMTPIISITFYTVLIRIAVAKNNPICASPDALSPLHFATRVVPSPSEPMPTDTRRSSI